MDNAADRKSIRRKEKASRLADTQRREVITQVMSTSFGRQWLWDILATCHIFATTFNGEALQSAFMEGQRATGLAILDDILLACPDQYIQAMRESNERSSTNERRSSPEPNRGDTESGDPDNLRAEDGLDYDPTVPGDEAFRYADRDLYRN